MSYAFFVSSLGDTELAIETIKKLRERNSTNQIYLIALTETAKNRIEKIEMTELIKITNYSKNNISENDFNLFIKERQVQRAYVGVPSNNNEFPYQIAEKLTIPCVIAYEYMFNSKEHGFWNHVNSLASKKDCKFAVPLQKAKEDILKINQNADVEVVGHLSIDRAENAKINIQEIEEIKKKLSIDVENELIFVSGTTQPTQVDTQFVEVLLKELSTGKYPNLQLRMGLHPGVENCNDYLERLLKICYNYPKTKSQFKIILNFSFQKKLTLPLYSNDFLFFPETDISGPEIAKAAEKVAQAVPGALLNEGALKGKPACINSDTVFYLPEDRFTTNIATFFSSKKKSPLNREQLDLEDTAPNLMAKLMTGVAMA